MLRESFKDLSVGNAHAASDRLPGPVIEKVAEVGKLPPWRHFKLVSLVARRNRRERDNRDENQTKHPFHSHPPAHHCAARSR